MKFVCTTNLTGYDFKFSYEVSVVVTLNKINLLITTSGNNGTDVSCIACLNKMSKWISDVVH